MLRTLPELRSRFGKVYVSFGEPLPLDNLLESHVPGWNRQQPVTEGEARVVVAALCGPRATRS